MPRRGFSHGLLWHFGAEVEELRRRPRPEVLVNYLGRFAPTAAQGALFRDAAEGTGAEEGGDGRRRHVFEIDAGIYPRGDGERLELAWTFSRHLHHRSTAEALARRVLNGMREFTTGEETYPLTALQEEMLEATLAAPGSGVYMELHSWILPQGTDVAALRRAWRRVIGRHPALRTSFSPSARQRPWQRVHRHVELPWAECDLSALDAVGQEECVATLMAEDARRGFDPEVAPLVRFLLVGLGVRRWRLVWSAHHLVLDGWSTPLLLAEVDTGHRRSSLPSGPRS